MKRREVLFVDGYNMIGSWPELVALQKAEDIQAARDLLLFRLSNYRKYRDVEVIVVFDAHLVPGITQTYDMYDLEVVFTKEGETADSYIERTVPQFINALTRVIVATSDAAEQWMIFQQGALRQSAKELLVEIKYTKQQIQMDIEDHYHHLSRRRSPWKPDQLLALNQLRLNNGKDNKG
ncbi:NYN domain-containing protein [Hutsoniella sourekii]